jgi:hypothetical protein
MVAIGKEKLGSKIELRIIIDLFIGWMAMMREQERSERREVKLPQELLEQLKRVYAAMSQHS